ncbi:hypothetical protein VUR80DRAFT_6999 [Thermomyces stellatus]
MKPILKKTSHSEKNSLDLDRGWEDAIHYSNHGWGGGKKSLDSSAGRLSTGNAPSGGAGGMGLYEGAGTGRAKDVSFSLSATDLGGVGSGYGVRKYSHARSASGTSHISVATSASGQRGGTFVHPFQQTPRASTPPLSYANSLAEVEAGSHGRDYSPTIAEGVDDLDVGDVQLRNYHAAPYSQGYSTSLRRPSLASQRTSSQTDVNSPPRLRINTARSNTVAATRPQGSRSDLCLDAESPQSATAPSRSHLVTSPSSSVAPLSPLRSSLEMNFRLRSRSELDTAARAAQIREARRQFEDKEAVKQAARDEKAARRRDAAAEREARKRRERPGNERRDTAGTGTGWVEVEKGWEGEEEEEEGVRKVSARRRTASVWTSFILWVRTKLLKAGRR